MSEYISACPKCLQNILCDTAYAGKRVACPVCMQEIIMPAPASPASAGASESGQATAGGKGRLPVFAIAISAAVLIMVFGAIAYTLGSRRPAPASASAPAAATPAVVASSPAAAPLPARPAAMNPGPVPVSESISPVAHNDPVASAPVQSIVPGSYKIVNRLNGLCLDVTTNITPKGSNVLKAVLNLYNGDQVWDIRACGTNQYSLLSPVGPSLELPASKQNGAQLELARWVHVPREVWTMVPTPDGYFQITCAASGGRVAEALGGTDGRQIVVQDASHQGSLNQQWSFQAP